MGHKTRLDINSESNPSGGGTGFYLDHSGIVIVGRFGDNCLKVSGNMNCFLAVFFHHFRIYGEVLAVETGVLFTGVKGGQLNNLILAFSLTNGMEHAPHRHHSQ